MGGRGPGLACTLAITAAACGSGSAVPSLPVEAAREASETSRITPPEQSWFDIELLETPSGGLLAWQDHASDVWVASLDPDHGLVVPGSERRMGDRAAPLRLTFNGPEFGLDAGGWALFYTRVEPGGRLQVTRARPSGSASVLDILTVGDEHFSPLATKTPGATTTRLVLLRRPPEWGTALWMDASMPGLGADFATLAERTDLDARWIDGTFQLATNNHPDFPGELSIVDTNDGSVTRVSEGARGLGNPYAWKAPESGGELYALATVDDRSLAVWGRIAGTWLPLRTVASPEAGFPFIGSPEPFVAAGRSYVSLVTSTMPDPVPGSTEQHVWVLGVDATTLPGGRRCDDGAPGPVTRVDPEVLLGRAEAFVYYYTLEGASAVAHRCATGIAAR
jgi:hypothetical protein